MNLKKAIRRCLAILLTLILILPFGEAVAGEEKELLRLHQVNIGGGDAYILTVGGLVILVDCGSDSTEPIGSGIWNKPLFEYLEALGTDHEDYHFVTHWHNDHCYNVNILAEMYGTDDLVVYGVSPEIWPELDPLAKGTYRQLRDGDHLNIGPLDILCISPPYREDLHGHTNRESMNFIVTYGAHTFMFTGDFMDWTLYKRWKDVLKNKVDVLSFPHHGLSNPISATKEVYRLVDPRVVLIPGGERGTVKSFALNEAHVGEDAMYLCNHDGNLLVTSDGTNLWVAHDVVPGELPMGDPVPPRAAEEDK